MGLLDAWCRWRERQLAKRLLEAIEQASQITCEQAEPQIVELVAAEAAGRNADQMPEFVEVILHLGDCGECTVMYAELSEKARQLTRGE